MKLPYAALCVSLSVAALAGCAGDGPPGSAADSQFRRVQSEIFNQKCVSAGCHNPQSNAGNLILTEGFSFDALVEVRPDNAVAAANGLSRVSPFSLQQSFLVVKVTGPGIGEGNQMPLGADPLSESEAALIEDWILAGAPRADGTLIGTPTLVPSAGTASPTATPSATATRTPTATPSATAMSTATATASEAPPSASPTGALPTATGAVTPDTPVPTGTPTTSPTASATATIAAYTFAELQSEIFTPRCATRFCHDAQTMSGSLVLAADVSYDELVGLAPENAAARSDGLLRVDPFAPDNSFLLVKLGSPPPLYGSPMPLIGTRLTDEELTLIRGWIETGATR